MHTHVVSLKALCTVGAQSEAFLFFLVHNAVCFVRAGGCGCSSVAAQARSSGFDSRQLPAFHFSLPLWCVVKVLAYRVTKPLSHKY